jgi:LysR family transcriptional repressor of citA
MDLRVLRTFQAAARLENFRETAERLGLSQPTVSAQIRELELELGEPLFDRTGRRVRLNQAGQVFLPQAEEALKAYDLGRQAVREHQKRATDHLTIAISPEPARTLLPRALHRYSDLYPDARISVEVLPSVQIAALLESGAADIGIGQIAADPDRYAVRCRELLHDRVVLVARHDGMDHDQAPAYWRHLLQEQRLLSHGHPAYWPDLLQSLEHAGIHPRMMRVTQVELTKRLVEEGIGVSFLPERAVRRELLEGRLMEVPAPGLALPTAPIFLILSQDPLTEPARAFLESLRATLHLGDPLV